MLMNLSTFWSHLYSVIYSLKHAAYTAEYVVIAKYMVHVAIYCDTIDNYIVQFLWLKCIVSLLITTFKNVWVTLNRN